MSISNSLVRLCLHLLTQAQKTIAAGAKAGIVVALHAACSHESWEMIYFLLENGADPNVVSEYIPVSPTSALLADLCYFSMLTGPKKGKRPLPDAWVRLVNTVTDWGKFHHGTPLAFAASRVDVKLVAQCLKRGADPNLQGLALSLKNARGLTGISLHL